MSLGDDDGDGFTRLQGETSVDEIQVKYTIKTLRVKAKTGMNELAAV